MRLPNLPLLRKTLPKRPLLITLLPEITLLLVMTLLLTPEPDTCEKFFFLFGSLLCFGLFVNLTSEQFLFNPF